MSTQPCRSCGGELRTRQADGLLAKYCDHCGSLPFAVDTKTGAAVRVDRSGAPLFLPEAVATKEQVDFCLAETTKLIGSMGL